MGDFLEKNTSDGKNQILSSFCFRSIFSFIPSVDGWMDGAGDSLEWPYQSVAFVELLVESYPNPRWNASCNR